MAHQTPIARWVLNNRERLKPSFVRYDWPDRYFNGVTDFGTTISVAGVESTGRGIDVDQDLALEKSAAEAVERYICKSLGIDSIGFAVSGESGARGHAEREALERHIFGEHQRLQIPFARIDRINTESSIIGEIHNEFERRNCGVGELAFFKMATPLPYHGYIATISKGGEVAFLGLALHVDVLRAVSRAFFEAVASFANFRDDPIRFESDRKSNPDAWNSHPEFLSKLSSLFGTSPAVTTPIPLPRLVSTPLDISGLKILSDCPIAPIKFVVQQGVEP